MAKWKLFSDCVLTEGAKNCQKAFDTLYEIGHTELVATAHQRVLIATRKKLEYHGDVGNEEQSD